MQAKLLAVVIAVIAGPALAQSGDPVRYQLVSVAGGFVRLDTVSGVMTFCRDEVDSFRCAPIATNDASTDMPRDGQMPRSDAMRRGQAEKSQAERLPERSEQDFDRALSMIEKAMRSFMAMSQDKPRDCAL